LLEVVMLEMMRTRSTTRGCRTQIPDAEVLLRWMGRVVVECAYKRRLAIHHCRAYPFQHHSNNTSWLSEIDGLLLIALALTLSWTTLGRCG
jgi:hypothetical protein